MAGRQLSPEEMRAALPQRGVLAGIDLRTKSIGLAFSDRDWRLAGPDTVLRRTKLRADLALLGARLAAMEARGIVLGMPLNMVGSSGPAAQRTRAFARALEEEFPLPLMTWDERLTSEAAKDAMATAGIPRSRWAEKIDAHAAALILGEALTVLVPGPPHT